MKRASSCAPISVVIPALNGLALLRENLPALLDEMHAHCPEGEVIVTDDGSADGTEEFVAQCGAPVRFTRNPGPAGFSRNCNHGARQVRHGLLFFLNTDVRVTPGVLSALARHFVDEELFGAGPSSWIRSGECARNEMPTAPRWEDGMLFAARVEFPAGGVQETFVVPGGFLMASKRLFDELGGFDEMFDPYYWEDSDLCLRARRRGWKLLHDPAAVVHHRHQGTIGRAVSPARVRTTYSRNGFLFNWKHLTEDLLRREHAPQIMKNLLHSAGAGTCMYEGLLEAMPLYPLAAERRRRLEACDRIGVEAFLRKGT